MLHHLMIGTWTPPGAIYTVEFDDEKLTLKLIKKTIVPHDEPISWITLDHKKKNIYGAAMKKWSSYSIVNPKEIEHQISLPIGGHPLASNLDTNTRAIFLLAAKNHPFNVYANPFYDYAGFGNVLAVNKQGSLESNIQNYEYEPKTGIHGMVFDSSETYLYSADLRANKIWTHKKDSKTGKLEMTGSLEAPAPTDHPRWVEIHPDGHYLYVLMEAGNRIGLYVIDESTHLPVFTQITYPLIPPDFNIKINPKMYRADVVFLSHSAKYLFATSRANSSTLTGYISVFEISPKGSIERQICMHPTSTSGGHSNAASPCDWSDEWLALTDDDIGGVEIYRWHKESLARVARLDITEPGFGMNAVWYD